MRAVQATHMMRARSACLAYDACSNTHMRRCMRAVQFTHMMHAGSVYRAHNAHEKAR